MNKHIRHAFDRHEDYTLADNERHLAKQELIAKLSTVWPPCNPTANPDVELLKRKAEMKELHEVVDGLIDLIAEHLRQHR